MSSQSATRAPRPQYAPSAPSDTWEDSWLTPSESRALRAIEAPARPYPAARHLATVHPLPNRATDTRAPAQRAKLAPPAVRLAVLAVLSVGCVGIWYAAILGMAHLF